MYYFVSKRANKRTFEARLVWNVESRVLPPDRVFSIASTRRPHLVEACNPITGLEFPYVLPNTVHNPRDIVTRVCNII